MPLILPKFGDGFILRDFRREDAEPLAEIEYDPEVKKYLSLPERERAEWVRLFAPDLVSGCAVEALPEKILAGQAAITRTDVRGQGELRIVIGKTFWGRGLGKKAASLLIPAAFQEMGANSIRAVVHPENRASLNLITSRGFVYKGKKEGDSSHWQYGHLIFELDRESYESVEFSDGLKPSNHQNA